MNPKVSRNRWVSGIRLTGGLVQLGLGVWVILDTSRATRELRVRWYSGEASQMDDLYILYGDPATLFSCFWCPYRYFWLWGIWLVGMGLWLAIQRNPWDWWLAAWGLFLGLDIMSDTLGGLLFKLSFGVELDFDSLITMTNFLFGDTFSSIISLIASGLLGVGIWLIARRFFLATGSPPAVVDATAFDLRSPAAPESAPVPSGEPMNPAPVSPEDG